MLALAQRTVFQALGDNLLIGISTVRAVTDLLVSGHLEQARPRLDQARHACLNHAASYCGVLCSANWQRADLTRVGVQAGPREACRLTRFERGHPKGEWNDDLNDSRGGFGFH